MYKCEGIEVSAADLLTLGAQTWVNSTAMHACNLARAAGLAHLVCVMDPLVASIVTHEEDESDAMDLVASCLGGLEQARNLVVLVAVNNQKDMYSSGDHWSLLVFSPEGCYYLCPMNLAVHANARLLVQRLMKYVTLGDSEKEGDSGGMTGMFVEGGVDLIQVRIDNPQTNSYDCGVYVCMLVKTFCDAIKKGKAVAEAVLEIRSMQFDCGKERLEMIDLIISKKV